MNGLCPFQDRGTSLFKEGRHIMGTLVHRSIACDKFVPDGNKIYLPLHLTPDHFINQAQFLHTLDFNTGTLANGDINILPDGPDTAFHLHRRTQQHPNVGSDILHRFGCVHIRGGGYFCQRNT